MAAIGAILILLGCVVIINGVEASNKWEIGFGAIGLVLGVLSMFLDLARMMYLGA